MFVFFSFSKRKGIVISDTDVVIYAQLLTGRKYVIGQNGKVYLEKQFAKQVLPFPYQTIVKVNIYLVFQTRYKRKKERKNSL